MPTLKIPSPLRTYTNSLAEVQVAGDSVAEAMENFVTQFPALRPHLYNGNAELRPFVNLFLNNDDIRHLQGLETPLKDDDRLMIVPSVAGGLPQVDHAALRTNQAFIIGLNVMAFVLDLPWLAALVALLMAIGTAMRFPAFGFVYRRFLKPRGWVKPDVLEDNPEPHRFAQGFGAAVLAAGALAIFAGAAVLGWGLVWLVIALAALNLFAGFCAGCAVYYWLNRLDIPGFVKAAPAGTFPGRRPKAKVRDA